MAKKQKTPDEDMAAELLLKDADEALRQDQMKALWDEWGSTIIGVALMIIFGTMVGVGWKNWRYNVHTSQTTALIQNNPEALSDSYKGISNLITAGQIASANTPAILYNMTNNAANAGLPREWDILAEWGALRAQADLPDTDKIDIAQTMETLSKKRKNPYAPAMMMEAAILYGNDGQNDKAITLLNDAQNHPLTSQNITLQNEIETLLTLYKSEVKS